SQLNGSMLRINPLRLATALAQGGQKPFPILVIPEDRFPPSMCLAWSPRERRGADFSPQGCGLAKEALEFCGRVCTVLTFLRDKSRAPAAILVGELNTYPRSPRFIT